MPGDEATQQAPAGEPLPTTDLGTAPAPHDVLAYSDHTTSVPVIDYQPPRLQPVWIVALVLLAAAAVAAATFFLGRATDDNPQVATGMTTSNSPPPPPTPAAVVVAPPTPDEAFLSALSGYGISSDDQGVQQRWMEFGHHACYAFAPPGVQEFDAVALAMRNAENNYSGGHMPQLTMNDAANLVRAGIAAYCPQFGQAVLPNVPVTVTPAPPAVVPPPATPNAAPTPPQSASVDDRYWAALIARGLASNSKVGSTGQGHQVCVSLDDGTSYPELMSRMGMTPRYSAGVIRTAVTVLCPNHADLLP